MSMVRQAMGWLAGTMGRRSLKSMGYGGAGAAVGAMVGGPAGMAAGGAAGLIASSGIIGATGRGARRLARPLTTKLRPYSGMATDTMAQGMFAASFAPLAMVGMPIMKGAGLMFSGGARAGKGILKHMGTAYSKNPRATGYAVFSGMALAGFGMTGHAGMRRAADERRRDPANTMGLSLAMHHIYGGMR